MNCSCSSCRQLQWLTIRGLTGLSGKIDITSTVGCQKCGHTVSVKVKQDEAWDSDSAFKENLDKLYKEFMEKVDDSLDFFF